MFKLLCSKISAFLFSDEHTIQQRKGTPCKLRNWIHLTFVLPSFFFFVFAIASLIASLFWSHQKVEELSLFATCFLIVVFRIAYVWIGIHSVKQKNKKLLLFVSPFFVCLLLLVIASSNQLLGEFVIIRKKEISKTILLQFVPFFLIVSFTQKSEERKKKRRYSMICI